MRMGMTDLHTPSRTPWNAPMNAPPTPQETQALTTAEEAANLPLPGRSAALSALGAAALAACGGGSDHRATPAMGQATTLAPRPPR